MTNTQTSLNNLFVANTDILPPPDLGTTVVSSDNASDNHLPSPTGCMPNVADTGRISFGAAYRLPQSK